MDREERQLIKFDFQPLIDHSEILAILLFGSQVSDSRTARDIDVCIIMGSQNFQKTLHQAWKQIGNKYDIWMFEEMPIYLKSEIIENHTIIWTQSEPDLFEYLYHFRKLIETYKYRLKVAYDEI